MHEIDFLMFTKKGPKTVLRQNIDITIIIICIAVKYMKEGGRLLQNGLDIYCSIVDKVLNHSAIALFISDTQVSRPCCGAVKVLVH